MKGQRFTLGQIRQAVLKGMGSGTDGYSEHCVIYCIAHKDGIVHNFLRSRWECQYQRDRGRGERAGE